MQFMAGFPSPALLERGIEQNPPIAKVLESGVAPRFLELAQCFETPKLQFEQLVWCADAKKNTHTRTGCATGMIY